jgi:hypothetical protein
MIGDPCYWCGAPATHFCPGCGKWICDAYACGLKSVSAVVREALTGMVVRPSPSAPARSWIPKRL